MNESIEFAPHDGNEAVQPKLNWLAFRYVSGEMSSEESAEFEARLADDELACVAVAEAVQLNEVVFAALDEERVTPVLSSQVEAVRSMNGRSLRSFATVTSLVALVALVAVLIFRGVSPRDSIVARLDRDQSNAGRIIAGATDESPVDAETAEATEILRLWVAPEQSAIARAETFERTSFEDADTLVAEIPDWLFAAVQAEAGLLGASAAHVEEN
jgi:anti-sigma-K factor RskA